MQNLHYTLRTRACQRRCPGFVAGAVRVAEVDTRASVACTADSDDSHSHTITISPRGPDTIFFRPAPNTRRCRSVQCFTAAALLDYRIGPSSGCNVSPPWPACNSRAPPSQCNLRRRPPIQPREERAPRYQVRIRHPPVYLSTMHKRICLTFFKHFSRAYAWN